MSVATSEPDVDPGPAELSGPARNLAFAVIAGAMLLAALDGTIVATALPTIVGDLGGAQHVSWVVTAYMLTEAISTALAGKFGDMYGRRTIFVGGILVFRDPVGTGAVEITGRMVAFSLVIVGAALMPAPMRATHAPAAATK